MRAHSDLDDYRMSFVHQAQFETLADYFPDLNRLNTGILRTRCLSNVLLSSGPIWNIGLLLPHLESLE